MDNSNLFILNPKLQNLILNNHNQVKNSSIMDQGCSKYNDQVLLKKRKLMEELEQKKTQEQNQLTSLGMQMKKIITSNINSEKIINKTMTPQKYEQNNYSQYLEEMKKKKQNLGLIASTIRSNVGLIKEKSKKRNWKHVVVIPQKLIRVTNQYILKNSYAINEDFYSDSFELNAETDINFIDNFKYIDFVNHQNNIVIANLKDYDTVRMPTQYIIQRFLSFGDEKYKKVVDLINLMEGQIEHLLQDQENQSAEDQKRLAVVSGEIQKFGMFEYQKQKIEEYMNLFPGKPIYMCYSNLLTEINKNEQQYFYSNLQNVCYNDRFVKLLGFEKDEFMGKLIGNKKQYDHIAFKEKEATLNLLYYYASLLGKKAYYDKNKPDEIAIPLPLNTKNGPKTVLSRIYYFCDGFNQVIMQVIDEMEA